MMKNESTTNVTITNNSNTTKCSMFFVAPNLTDIMYKAINVLTSMNFGNGRKIHINKWKCTFSFKDCLYN
ncbi:hypothetical protein SCHIN_v1c03050 [Spiroplasma chinense]|uniref:Uncharacterized protein n=1 Tax=Spiroplasma chinense TaxID=216932 RepID=A0A5B9Y633_9MOLU|nr:hypothetical protein [Spiroplasma chinense]QEH61502.1 hypothetical protein SCHIN_v1c03050 [Spiroplasma chinense]